MFTIQQDVLAMSKNYLVDYELTWFLNGNHPLLTTTFTEVHRDMQDINF